MNRRTSAEMVHGAPLNERTPVEQRDALLKVYRDKWEDFYHSRDRDLQAEIAARASIPRRARLREDDEVDEELRAAAARTEPVRVKRLYLARPESPDEPDVRSLSPLPAYEYVRPAPRNVTVFEEEAEFVPFADELPTDGAALFDAEGYLDTYEWQPKWQNKVENPDKAVIQLETVRYAMEHLGLSATQIDATRVLPPLHSQTKIVPEKDDAGRMRNKSEHHPGLLFHVAQRDRPAWSAGPLILEEDVDIAASERTLLQQFCPSLNCVEVECPQHFNEYTLPEAPKAAPRELTMDRCRAKEACSAGEACWVKQPHLPDPDSAGVQYFMTDVRAQERMRRVLDVYADYTPCQISAIINKPCADVAAYMTAAVEDGEDDIIYKPDAKHVQDLEALREELKENAKLPSNFACSHNGPCEEARKACPCYTERRYCGRLCRCGRDCEMRWPGCKCESKGRRACMSAETCDCWAAGRECDVEACFDCGVGKILDLTKRADRKRDTCMNASLQRNVHATIEIRQSEIGYGAFAMANLPKGAFVAEYLGERVDMRDTSRAFVRLHSHRNYSFRTSEPGDAVPGVDFEIDAAVFGNTTRFPNDPGRRKKGNLEARIKLVYDDRRIGYWTTKAVKKGDELLLPYGEDFWSNIEGEYRAQ